MNHWPRLRRIHILLVGGAHDERDLVEAALRTCGARVTAARSFADATSGPGRGPVDVVIVDVDDPRACPMEVRALPPAIAVGSRGIGGRDRCDAPTAARLFAAQLTRPIDLDAMLRTVAALTKRWHLATDVRRRAA